MNADWRITVVVLVGSFLLTPFLRHYALKRGVVDVPNARSSHELPTPRGGGLAIAISYLIGLIVLGVFYNFSPRLVAAFSGAGVFVAAVGFWDDHGHVKQWLRVLVHFIAAVWGLFFITTLSMHYDTSMSALFFNIFLIVSMVWLINLYNFMDGIDAFASMETIFFGLCSAFFFYLNGANNIALLALLLAVSTVGFLVWNLPPARIFLGDIGSGFLGIVIGVLVLAGIKTNNVNIWVWVILLGVFLADSTITVARRIFCGLKWYEAHRSHAYQHLAIKWKSHGKVTLAAAAVNLFWLFPLAFCAWNWPSKGVFFAFIAYIPLIWLAIHFQAGKEEKNM